MYNLNKSFLIFIVGLFIGSYLAFYIKSKTAILETKHNRVVDLPKPLSLRDNSYDTHWFKRRHYTRIIEPIDVLRYSNNWHRTEAQVLQEDIKVLCVILSQNDKTANAGVRTWAKGCNNVTVVSLDRGRKHKHVVAFKQTGNGQNNSNWNKLCDVIKDIDHQKYEWVLFVREQTFVLLENLRWFVASLDYRRGYYLGHAEMFWNVRYNLAQAGWVLSRGSLELLRREFQKTGCKVSKEESLMLNKEDFTLGKILSKYDIFPLDTRDANGFSTFNAFNWQQEFFSGMNYYKNSLFPRKCCSSRVITFKGIEQDKFYMYQYLLYQLDVFEDGNFGNKPLPSPKDKDFVWKQFLAEHGIYRNVTAEEYYDIWKKTVSPDAFQYFDKHYD